jgi:hypothetical protein
MQIKKIFSSLFFAINPKEQTQVINTLYKSPLSPKLPYHQLKFGSMSPLVNNGLFSPTLQIVYVLNIVNMD